MDISKGRLRLLAASAVMALALMVPLHASAGEGRQLGGASADSEDAYSGPARASYTGYYEKCPKGEEDHIVLHLKKNGKGSGYTAASGNTVTEGWGYGDEGTESAVGKDGGIPSRGFYVARSITTCLRDDFGLSLDEAQEVCGAAKITDADGRAKKDGEIVVSLRFNFISQKHPHTAYFDLNGGTIDGKSEVAAITLHEGEKYTLYGEPVLPGYKFRYWNDPSHPFGGTEVMGDSDVYYTAVKNTYPPGLNAEISPQDWWTSGDGTFHAWYEQDKSVGWSHYIGWERTDLDTGETLANNHWEAAEDYSRTETQEGRYEYKAKGLLTSVVTDKRQDGTLYRYTVSMASNPASVTVGSLCIDKTAPRLVVKNDGHVWNSLAGGYDIKDPIDGTVAGHGVNQDDAWTNEPITITADISDLLMNGIAGSGIRYAKITRDDGYVAAEKEYDVDSTNRGPAAVCLTYTLKPSDSGRHDWTVETSDTVGHVVTKTVTTRYDVTGCVASGTEQGTREDSDGILAAYCPDNVISQDASDVRYDAGTNYASGLMYVAMYRYIESSDNARYQSMTKMKVDGTRWVNAGTGPYVDTQSDASRGISYDSNTLSDDEHADYYLIVMIDQAGNVSRKRLITQRDALTWFHTSIDRSSYDSGAAND